MTSLNLNPIVIGSPVEVISSISSLRLKADVTDEKCQSNRNSAWVVIFSRKLINKFAFWMLKSATFFFFFGSSFVHSLKSNTSDTERNEYFLDEKPNHLLQEVQHSI